MRVASGLLFELFVIALVMSQHTYGNRPYTQIYARVTDDGAGKEKKDVGETLVHGF